MLVPHPPHPPLVGLKHSLSAGLSQGDKQVLKVNKLTSVHTQLPYEYYSLPYCRPDKIESSAENLGEVLRGDRIETSPYEVMLAFSELQCPAPADPPAPTESMFLFAADRDQDRRTMQGAVPHSSADRSPGEGVHQKNRGRVSCEYVR